MTSDWWTQALCAGPDVDPDWWSVETALTERNRRAMRICEECPQTGQPVPSRPLLVGARR